MMGCPRITVNNSHMPGKHLFKVAPVKNEMGTAEHYGIKGFYIKWGEIS